jgi:glycosyltransferase involved in cell wall biosynthesis
MNHDELFSMKLSIITINKDNAQGLEKTIQSVVEQTYNDFEYIVIDGASSDGSVDIIKKFADRITYWVSEPDTGIYNAMNKGIRKAWGEYCLFLNSGDLLFAPSVLKNVIHEVSNTANSDIYYANSMTTEHNHFIPPQSIDINYFLTHGINHQNTLIKRSLFVEHGLYNEDFRIAADFEFWLRECWLYKVKFTYMNTNIVLYDATGISSTSKFDSEIEKAYRCVFGSLAESLIVLRRYRIGTYGSIIETYGNSKLLDFFLKTYRYLCKKFNVKGHYK